MNRTVNVLVLVGSAFAGCTGDDQGDRPILPGGGPSVPATTITRRGSVCVTDDLRDSITCTSVGLEGLIVTSGEVTTTTAADGTFTLTTSSSTLASDTFTVTGTSATGLRVVPTTSAVTSGNLVLPAVDADLFARMLTSNGILLDASQGSVLSRVTRNGVPASGVLVTATPSSAFGPFYDTSSPVLWGLGGTATRGVILVPGLTAGAVDLSYETTLGGVETLVSGIPVRNGGVTVLDTVLPGTIP